MAAQAGVAMKAGFRLPAPAAYGLSAALHAAAFVGLVRMPGLLPASHEDVRVEVIETVRPPPEPPAPPPPLPAAPAPPAPAIRRTALRPTPPAPPRAAPAPPPPTPAPEAPPPPNAPPPDGEPSPVSKAPVRIGIAFSSSTTGGGVAAPAGNTLYGAMPRSGPDPTNVKPYWNDRYVPPTQVTALPRPLDACYRTSPDDYPEQARRLGVEAVVQVMLTLDETGAIVDARVVQDPGHGLGPAAVASLKRHGCRFAPARKGDQPVGITHFGFKVRFELP